MPNYDTLTNDNLPDLRADLLGFAGDDRFSDVFRAICREAASAIDLALAEDAATHARLNLAVVRFTAAATEETAAC